MALFFIDMGLHVIAYGMLYLKHLMPIVELILILVNVSILLIKEA